MAVANGKGNSLTRIKVKSNQQGVKIRAPQAVRPGLNLTAAPGGR
jgi:hypothetical protein